MAETATYVLSDPKENSNKFWAYSIDGERATFRWGRVGETEQTLTKSPFNRKKDLETKIREKTKKGYALVDVMDSAPIPAGGLKTETVRQAALTQLSRDPNLSSLIDRLVAANKHELVESSGGRIDVDLSTGVVRTAVGVITEDTVAKARPLLNDLAVYVKNEDFQSDRYQETLGEYLRLVPQRVGRNRGWHIDFLPNDEALSKQLTLLDQLEASAKFAKDRIAAATSDHIKTAPKLFDAQIKLNDDPNVHKDIRRRFEESLNKNHASAKLKIANIYDVTHTEMDRGWFKDGSKLDNRMILWHGTRTFNVLSILKSGLFIPKSGGSIQITGRMFGDGLYFSDQSTKSLNYSQGYWSGGSDDRCFMFLFEVGMGKYHVPARHGGRLPPPGYDSVFAKGGESGVLNNEMIVFRTSQCRPFVLVEFTN